MKSKFIQKMMAGALAAALVVTPSISALASGSGTPGSGAPSSSSSKSTAEEAVIAIINQSNESNGSNEGGSYVSSLAGITGSYGLITGEVPYARFSNMDVKKSNLAKAVIDDAAAALGAAVGPCINIELGKKAGGKFTLLSQDGENITIKIGVPKSFAQDGKTYAMICVRPGGAVSVLPDTDADPNTVTFDTKGGQGAYAIVKY